MNFIEKNIQFQNQIKSFCLLTTGVVPEQNTLL